MSNTQVDVNQGTAPLSAIDLRGLFGDRNVHIDLAEGPITLLFGLNGAGKSTVLRIINRMMAADMSSVTRELVSQVDLHFSDQTMLGFRGGATPHWLEQEADGSIRQGGLDDQRSDSSDPLFRKFVESDTPYMWRDGEVLNPGGTRVAETELDDLHQIYWRMRRREKGASQMESEGNRRLRRVCALIGSDRLIGSTEPRDMSDRVWLPPSIRRMQQQGVDREVVTQIASKLKAFLSSEWDRARLRTSELDSSFVHRALRKIADPRSAPMDTDSRRECLGSIAQLQGRLRDCALSTSAVGAMTDQDLQAQGGQREVGVLLDLYLDDLMNKAQANESALQKLELYADILNTHFYDKQARLHQEYGLVVERADGTGIPLQRLSSGEKHLVVLFHRLIFDTSPGGLCLIDEPEISLHVDWQEKFVKSVKRVCDVTSQQFIIATHSPIVIGNDSDLLREVTSGTQNDARSPDAC
jgi:predicted ATPase